MSPESSNSAKGLLGGSVSAPRCGQPGSIAALRAAGSAAGVAAAHLHGQDKLCCSSPTFRMRCLVLGEGALICAVLRTWCGPSHTQWSGGRAGSGLCFVQGCVW